MRRRTHRRGELPAASGRITPPEIALVAIGLLILLIAAGGHFDVLEIVYDFSRRYEAWEMDEIISALLLTPLLTTSYYYYRTRRYRAAANQTRRLAGEILNALPHSFTVSNADGDLIYVNPAGQQRIRADSTRGAEPLKFPDLYPESLRDHALRNAIDAAARNGVWSGYLTRITHDGREFPTADVIVTHRDPDGRPRYVSSISRDISERVALEQRLQHKRKLEAVGRLSGGIAHQYNNLLMVIAGHARRAMKQAGDTSEATSPLQDVLRTVDLAAAMTRDLLLFTRRQPLKKRVVRIARILDDVEKLLEPLLDDRYRLEIIVNDADACAETDANELAQATMNLAVNARDAMPTGGRISIEMKTVVLGQTETVDLPPGPYVRLQVSDTGTGIDPEVRGQLFEPFFTTKESGKGTGLGLPMVLGFAEACGGTVAIESEPGQGATFSVYLPQTDRQPSVSAELRDSDVAGNGETILLVEDNDDLREIVAEMLDGLGYRVLTAADGFEAVERDEEHESDIDLLLTDMVLPNLCGPKVDRIIRQHRSGIKTLFISGYPSGQAGAAVEPIPDGATLLRKPIEPTELARAVKAKLTESTSPAPAPS